MKPSEIRLLAPGTSISTRVQWLAASICWPVLLQALPTGSLPRSLHQPGLPTVLTPMLGRHLAAASSQVPPWPLLTPAATGVGVGRIAEGWPRRLQETLFIDLGVWGCSWIPRHHLPLRSWALEPWGGERSRELGNKQGWGSQTLLPSCCQTRDGFLLFSPCGLLPSQRQGRKLPYSGGVPAAPSLQPSMVLQGCW